MSEGREAKFQQQEEEAIRRGSEKDLTWDGEEGRASGRAVGRVSVRAVGEGSGEGSRTIASEYLVAAASATATAAIEVREGF